MLTITEALAQAAAEPTARRGDIERILGELSPGDADALLAALNSTMGAKRIADALRLAGHDVGRGSVEGWRGRHGAR